MAKELEKVYDPKATEQQITISGRKTAVLRRR